MQQRLGLMNSHRGTWRRILGFLFFIFFAGSGASPAFAHNSLVESTPAAGAILAAAPQNWSLVFKKDVPLESASAEIVNEAGIRTALAIPRHGASAKEILFTLPPDISGAVTGRWRLVGSDGHVISARVKFTVEQTAPVGSGITTTSGFTQENDSGISAAVPVGDMEDAMVAEPVRIGIRIFGYAALLLLGGMLFTESFITGGVAALLKARSALAISAAALVIVPLLQALIFLDDSRDFGVFNSLFHILEAFDTTPGSMYLIRFFAGVVMCLCVWRALNAPVPKLSTSPMLIAMGVNLVALAYVGHSRSMAWPFLGVPTDVVHTMAALAWLGGLIVFIFFIIPNLEPEESFKAFQRFGNIATYAVTTIVITGVIQTLRLHGTFLTLFTENHGRWLLLKLILVAAMLKIGDINRRRLIKRVLIDESALAQRVSMLRRASTTEIVNGGLVMIITSVLVSSSF